MHALKDTQVSSNSLHLFSVKGAQKYVRERYRQIDRQKGFEIRFVSAYLVWGRNGKSICIKAIYKQNSNIILYGSDKSNVIVIRLL